MRKVSFLLFLTAACTAFAAGEFRVEKKGENAVILDNTTVGCDKHKMPVMPLIDSGTVIKKVFILENAPAAFRKPVKASISIFWNCKDQSAAVRKIAKNGFNEQFRLVVNGHEMILPTSDDRLPKNKMQWTEISFPVEWLKPGVNNITLSKIHGPGKDDFIYVGVDTATEPLFSRISLDGGKNFAQYSRHFSSLKGEFLIKLILYQTVSEVTVNFDDSSEVKTTGSAKVDGGFLNIDGTLGYATIPGSEKFNVTPKGLTIAGFVRQLPPAPGSSKKDNNMMLAFKDKAWFIGRTGNSFNLSFCTNGRVWNNAAFGGECPDIGQWMHLAAVFEHVNETAQGNVGYNLIIYVNGEAVLRKFFLYAQPDASDDPVITGSLPYNESHTLNGEIDSLKIYDRTLSVGEITALARSNDKISFIAPGFAKVPESLNGSFAQLKKQLKTPEKIWLADALYRAAETGYPADRIAGILSAQKDFFNADHAKSGFYGSWNKLNTPFKIVESNGFMLLLNTGKSAGNPPILGFFDPHTGKEIGAGRITGWQLDFSGKKVRDFSAGVSFELKNLRQDGKKWLFTVVWQVPDLAECTSEFTFDAGRLEQTLQVKNLAANHLLKEVLFPRFFVNKLPGKKDHLLFPLFSGVTRPDPTGTYSESGLYPSARASMLLMAYYDNLKNGIYCCYEADDCAIRTLRASGKNNTLEFLYENPVGYAKNQKGGNNFTSAGPGVLQAYRGDWFEAGQIYKHFVETRAPWAVTELPRKDTPKWYRDNLFWMCQMASSTASQATFYLREYYEEPFAIWTGRWQWIDQTVEPDLIPFPSLIQAMKECIPKGIYIHPYLNARIWGYPEDSRYFFERKNDPKPQQGGVLQENGQIYTEKYGRHYPIMCSKSPIWHERLEKNAAFLRSLGAPGVYWDQLPCSTPKLCFNADHGHLLNDPAAWANGYREFLTAFRKKYPDVAMDGEDNCEVYVNTSDGFMTWRFTEPDQVPLFQSVYSGGRCQFTSRAFNAFGSGSGSYHSGFAKLACQLCYGEQIGWMHLDDSRPASPMRLYAKKMIHLRKALLSYFNAADMLRPLDFVGKVPEISEPWGGNAAGKRARDVVTPLVMHTPWKRLADGRIMIVFTNTTEKAMTVQPKLNYPGMDKLAVCSENRPVEYVDLAKSPVPAVKLPPLATEIWLIDRQFPREEAESVGKVTRRIATFDAGEMLQRYIPRFKNVKDLKAGNGNVITAQNSSWRMYACREDVKSLGFENKVPELQDNWIQMRDGAIVCFDSMIFGDGEADAVKFHVACRDDKAGGKLVLWDVTGSDTPDRKLAEFTVPGTGGWFDFRDFTVPMAKSTGRRLIMLRFEGNKDQECAFRRMTTLKTGNGHAVFPEYPGLRSSGSFRIVKADKATSGRLFTARDISWYLSAEVSGNDLLLNPNSMITFNSIEFMPENMPENITVSVSSADGGKLIITDATGDEAPYFTLAEFDIPAGTTAEEFTLPLKVLSGKRMLTFRSRGKITLHHWTPGTSSR